MNNSVKISLSFLVLVSLSFFHFSCNKAITFKQLKGEWTISEFTYYFEEGQTENFIFDPSTCDLTGAIGRSFNNTIDASFDGSTYNQSSTSSSSSDPDETSAESLTQSMTILFKENGTYILDGTYSYTYVDDLNGKTTVYSGTFRSMENHWFLLDNKEKNAAIMFENFPGPVDFEAIVLNGTLYSSYENRTFDIEDSSKDKVSFFDSHNETKTDQKVLEYTINISGTDTDCTQTTDVIYTTMHTLSMTISK